MVSAPPHRLVEVLEERFRDLEIEFHKAYWDSQVEATVETDARRAELELELRRVKGDTQALSSVEEALAQELHDPLLRRQLEVLRLSLIGNQMDDVTRSELVELSGSVESDFASFRPEVEGQRVTDNEILEILTTSNDSDERYRAWEASKEIGALVEERVRDLVRLRNKAARELGFADYYRMTLELEEIGESWLFARLDEVIELTDDTFRSWKAEVDDRLKKRFNTEVLYPWHYADPFFQELPPDGRVGLDHLFADADVTGLALSTFARWGIDLTSVFEVSDLYPRERKCQHAFCMDIDRTGRDVRVLTNVVPGEHWTSVLLHESGHAAYDVCLDPHLPYLLHRPSHTLTTEAMAILCGRLVHEPRWLREVAGFSTEEVDEVVGGIARANAAQDLILARWVPVMSHFERALYSDPETDLDSLWWELVERFQLVTPPPDRRASDWAAKIHIAVAPVYYHNYLLGAMLASQIERACERDLGAWIGSPEGGPWLRERLFKPGSSFKWTELVERATARPLSAEDFAAHVGGALG